MKEEEKSKTQPYSLVLEMLLEPETRRMRMNQV